MNEEKVFRIRWPEAVGNWTTTAGVNTSLAKADPDALVAAYPDADVTYWYVGRFVYNVPDRRQGIATT